MMLLGVVCMSIALSFLLNVGYGTDTCSFMNSSLATRLGLSIGIVMASTNILLFIPELIWGRRLIGLGTFFNMLAIGYIIDLCMILEERFIPRYVFLEQPYRSLVFAAALAFFLVSVAVYLNADMGQSPFDSFPTIISGLTGLQFFAMRMAWDFLAILIGVLMGGKLTIGTVILALTIGPSVSWIGKGLKRIL